MSAETHLALDESGWVLIHQGKPLPSEGNTFNACMATAARKRLHVGAFVWIAAKNRFGSVREARDEINRRNPGNTAA